MAPMMYCAEFDHTFAHKWCSKTSCIGVLTPNLNESPKFTNENFTTHVPILQLKSFSLLQCVLLCLQDTDAECQQLDPCFKTDLLA